MTDDTPPHAQMPLTLAFKPDNIHEDDPEYEFEDIVVVQPSTEESGRIFLACNPFGKPVGCHLLPEEARRVRDHLSKLLLDPDAADEAVQSVKETPETLQSRIDRAVERVKASPEQQFAILSSTEERPKWRWPRPQFRVEFKWGRLEAIIARTNDKA